MHGNPRSAVRAFAFLAALACTAALYSYTIFSNICIDGDTLNWAASLAPLEGKLTLAGSLAVKGWFTKFHLLMFAMVYLVTKVCSIWGPWDFLLGFKVCTLACALLTPAVIYFICRNTMRSFPVMLVTSFIPLYTLGYSWLITTCDDNVLANLFNLVFVACVLIASGAIMERERERRSLTWAFVTGLAAGLSMASHLKNIVALPLVFAPAVFRPPFGTTRPRIIAATLAGLLVSFGIPYSIYWVQSAGEPLSSKLDFWVFHRVPGRFYPTSGDIRPTPADHLVFVLAGIRASLYAFQELIVHTDIYDGDVLGPILIALFFAIYAVSACRTWRRRAVKILFALFLLDAGHSFLYDSWVVERWDSFTLPVFITIGIYWDSVASGGPGGRTRFQRTRFSLLLGLFMGALIWTNARSTRLLIGITNGSLPYQPDEKKWWAQKRKFYFYFDHRRLVDLARSLDRHFTDGTYFLSLRYMQQPDSYVYVALDQYLNIYSKRYRERVLHDPSAIGEMVARGELAKLLYLDTARVPLYTGTARSLVIFDPSTIRTVYENDQLVLKEVGFRPPPRM